MPRTTTIECPGCPPIRALTFDVLGLIKVVEARNKENGVPRIVEKWGEPDSSKCILTASINDRKFNPLLAVARKNGLVEVLSPLTGDPFFSIPNDGPPEEDAIAGLHLFKKKISESSDRSCTLLRCSTKGHANISSYKIPKSANKSVSSTSTTSWDVCASGTILCSKVDRTENYALFGGKGVEINLWDLEKHDRVWTSKPPPKNSLGIFTPTCFTSATFTSDVDHRKVAAGTNSNQVHIYDISAQRRPVMTFNFRETPIKALSEDPDGNTIYLGNGSGDLASFDTRTGKLLGCFLGKCSGSIRSITRHPELPLIASCGLDSYVRVWDVNSRQLISAVFLKQHLNCVVFDTNFTLEDITQNKAEEVLLSEKKGRLDNDGDDKDDDDDDDEDEESRVVVKRKKSSKEHKASKKLKSKKKSKLEES